MSAIIPQSVEKSRPFRFTLDEGKAGRSPRALPKPDDPFFAEKAERSRDLSRSAVIPAR